MYVFKFNNYINAFTIIEILIVLAILGILSAISISMYQSYLQSAFQSEVVSKMKALELEQTSLFATNGTYACDIEDFKSFNDGGNDKKYILNNNKIAKRKFTMSIDTSNCTSSGTNAHYIINAENAVPESNRWKVKWQFKCGIDSSKYSCQPELIKGKSIINDIF
jgi:prepilin-type N-terminal cleavage/methylation domain-containing protein